MNDDQILKDHLVKLLEGRQAHLNAEDILTGVPFEAQGRRVKRAPHTLWQLLEHLRIAQWDILEFSRNPDHISPDFPQGYWPSGDVPPDEESWDRGLAGFKTDLKAMQALVADPSTDLYSPISHGDGQTILREALLVADHNAYHLGQVLLVRRLLGCQPEKRLG
jgi:hypothetical protein